MNKKTTNAYAICLELAGGIYEFAGKVFMNYQDAQDYLAQREADLKAQIAAGIPENTLKLESLRHYEIITCPLYLTQDEKEKEKEIYDE